MAKQKKSKLKHIKEEEEGQHSMSSEELSVGDPFHILN